MTAQIRYCWTMDIAKKSADLSKIPAVVQNGKTTNWDNIDKDIARYFWIESHKMLQKYPDGSGSQLGSAILGCLEDTYPDWVEEFEDSYE